MENKFFENDKNNLDAWWDPIRKRNDDHSFPQMTDWIRQMHKSVGKSRFEKIKRRRRLRWFALALLPGFLILSCTVPVNRVEKAGSLVNFGIDSNEHQSLKKLSSLQHSLAFTFYEFFQPAQPGITFFIVFIPDKEEKKLGLISHELKNLYGLRNLDISSIKYTIRESLLSTFWHSTLKLGKQQKPTNEELARNIQATLKDKGLGFLSINILNGEDGEIAFASAIKDSTGVAVPNKVDEKQNPETDKIRKDTKAMDNLQIFDWLTGSWKVKYVPQKTYHYWLKINDGLMICFIIKYKGDELINFGDEGPDISVGFTLRHSKLDSVVLSLRGIEWKFLSADDKEIRFKNEITPKSAHVKWALGDEKKSWQSAISGERNLEVVNLIRDENTSLENIVKEFIEKNPDVIKRS